MNNINNSINSPMLETDAMLLTCTLVFISLNCITYLRGIFEEDNYVDTIYRPQERADMQSETGQKGRFIRLKTLKRNFCEASDTFLNWIELGVYQAISLKYLKAIQFSIYFNKGHPEDVSECYFFSFDYENNALQVNSSTSANIPISSRLDTREKVMDLIKRLILITQNLDPLPDESYISMRLLYNNSCPAGYQAPIFKDASDMPVATVRTGNYQKSFQSVGDINIGFNKSCVGIITQCCLDETAYIIPIDPFGLVEEDIPAEDEFGSVLSYGPNIIEIPSISIGENNQEDITADSGPLTLKDIVADKLSLEPTQRMISNQKPFVWTFPEKECISGCSSETTTGCIKCRRKIIPVCYGNYNDRDLLLIKCYACCFENEVLDIHLIMLMKARFLWIHLMYEENFPSSKGMYELLNLDVNKAEDNVIMETILNIFFGEDVLCISSKPFTKIYSSELVHGHGTFKPLTANLVYDNERLLETKQYYIGFMPKIHPDPSFYDFKNLLFPNHVRTRKNVILNNLSKFKKMIVDYTINVTTMDESDANIDRHNTTTESVINQGQVINSDSSLESVQELTDITKMSFEDAILLLSQFTEVSDINHN
ncbi:HORMA domain-containing protein [Scheffersomyces amazonensis]|uniref:HORMA domain-containing protein n=1 Tax=Scheffersomyces amazonensis TaxID=1078765 RepID=UPI00315CA0CE